MTSASGALLVDRSGSVSAAARRRHAPTTTSAAADDRRDEAPQRERQELERHEVDRRLGEAARLEVLRDLADDVRRAEREQDACPRRSTSSQRLTPMPGWSQRRNLIARSSASSPLASCPLELAVEDLDRLVAALAEPARELLGEDDRAVAAAGAADADREPALALGREGRDR